MNEFKATRYYEQKDFAAGQFVAAVRAVLEDFRLPVFYARAEFAGENGVFENRKLKLDDLYGEIRIGARPVHLAGFFAYDEIREQKIYLNMMLRGDALEFHVGAESAEMVGRVLELMEGELGITRLVVSRPESRCGAAGGGRVFIAHGRSSVWRDLKDFLADRLNVPWDEFNRTPVAGVATAERLEEMLNAACFAFIVMTGEEQGEDGRLRARDNVIHEAGLFQGRLGFRKAVVLIEEGCDEFSNIEGLTQIRFPQGDLMAKTEELRRVLEREGIVR